MTFLMDPLAKFLTIAGAVAVVIITVFAVTCWVQRGCLLYDFLHRREKERRLKSSNGNVYGSGDRIVMTQYMMQEKPTNGSVRSNKSMASETSSEQGSVLSRQDSTYYSMSSGRGSPTGPGHAVRRDGNSSGGDSMSVIVDEDCSSPASPPPYAQQKRNMSTTSVTATPSISVSMLLTYITTSGGQANQQSASSVQAKLAIAVESVSELPGRDYGTAYCDPWVGVSVIRQKPVRSLRRATRRASITQLAQFRTKTIRHAQNPFYSQTFVADLGKDIDMREVSVRFTVMDQDRHAGPTEIGKTSVTLKEARQTEKVPERVTLCLPLADKKAPGEKGEFQFGLSYLPTAQRLSFSLQRASKLKQDPDLWMLQTPMTGVEIGKAINPFVKILMFNQSTRLLKKKKSAVFYDTKDPNFDETINFEVEPSQLETSSFLVLICSKIKDPGLDLEREDSSDQESIAGPPMPYGREIRSRKGSHGRLKDLVLGRVSLGRSVRGKAEHEQWRNVLENPRKVFVVNHLLK